MLGGVSFASTPNSFPTEATAQDTLLFLFRRFIRLSHTPNTDWEIVSMSYSSVLYYLAKMLNGKDGTSIGIKIKSNAVLSNFGYCKLSKLRAEMK